MKIRFKILLLLIVLLSNEIRLSNIINRAIKYNDFCVNENSGEGWPTFEVLRNNSPLFREVLLTSLVEDCLKDLKNGENNIQESDFSPVRLDKYKLNSEDNVYVNKLLKNALAYKLGISRLPMWFPNRNKYENKTELYIAKKFPKASPYKIQVLTEFLSSQVGGCYFDCKDQKSLKREFDENAKLQISLAYLEGNLDPIGNTKLMQLYNKDISLEEIEKQVNQDQKHMVDLYIKNQKGKNIFDVAIADKRLDIVKALLRVQGRNSDFDSKHRTKALYVAASCNDAEMVKMMLDEGVRIDQKILMRVVWEKHFDVAQAIIAAGADVNFPNKYDWFRPLHQAALNSDVKMVKLLLEHGANPHLKTITGQTPLHYAAISGSVDIVDLLMKNGVNIDEKDTSGETAFDKIIIKELNKNLIPCNFNFNIDNDAQHAEIIKILRAGKTDNSDMEKSLIYEAIQFNGLNVIKALIDERADLDWQDEYGFSALRKAIINKRPDIAMMLIKAGADVNSQCKNRRTPLHAAIYMRNPVIIKTLLNAGADSNMKDIAGWTPMDCAVNNHYSDVVGILNSFKTSKQ